MSSEPGSQIMFVINSMITPAAPSVFTPEERYSQLLDTIASIKRFAPRSEICIVEGSNPTAAQMETLSSLATYVIVLFDHLEFNVMSHCGNPRIGELGQLYVAFDWLINNNKLTDKTHVIKLTGRYGLTESFSTDVLHDDDILESALGSLIYCAPKRKFEQIRQVLHQALEMIKKDFDMNEILQTTMNTRIISHIGVTGFRACDGVRVNF